MIVWPTLPLVELAVVVCLAGAQLPMSCSLALAGPCRGVRGLIGASLTTWGCAANLP